MGPATGEETGLHQNSCTSLKKIESGSDDIFESDDAMSIQAGNAGWTSAIWIGKVLLVEGNASDLKATVFFQGFGQNNSFWSMQN